MSASPSGAPPAGAGPPNGAPATRRPRPPPNPLRPMRRRPQAADPLVPRKRPAPKPTGPSPAATNGPSDPARLEQQQLQQVEAMRRQHGGWSTPAPDGAQYFPVFTTKRALREGMRYHVMRFGRPRLAEEDKPVDPADQDEFARPVTLHRRDPRQPPPGRELREEPPEETPVEDKEAEKLAQAKAERDAQRAIDQAKIAPVIKEATARKPKKHKEEKTSFYRAPKTEEGKKESEIRYEEALPWHLEDADAKNIWVGNYISALSEANSAVANVAFVVDRPGFRMIPLEKWYKFTSKPPFTPYSIDQAEALMSQKTDVGRWAMRHKEQKEAQEMRASHRRHFDGPPRVKNESNTFRAASRAEKMEHDDLDISGDEFQDDDENPGFDLENEDERDQKERIRRDQLGANLFGEADENEVDREALEEQREEENRKKLGKKLKKALIKREQETLYKSDSSDSNPYSSSSDDDSSDSDEEADVKKEDDAKGGAKADGKDKTPASSAPAAKGSSTPQGKQKQTEAAKKAKSLKRPGSPNLSESSGNESSRKKAKGPSSVQSRSTTPLPGSQTLPNQPIQKSKLAGSMSDGEMTGGEMSDGQPRKKKIKLLGPGGRATPAGSRAGSPLPTPQAAASPVSPRAGSPSGLVEAWEIVNAIPAEGITIGGLMKHFQSRVGGPGPGQMDRKDWIKLVKENCNYGPDKLLRRRD